MESQFILSALALLAAGLATPAQAQFDVTPREGVYYGEATPFRCVRFRDGEKVVRFVPPDGWRFVADSKDHCECFPSGLAQATGSFSVARDVAAQKAPTPEQLQELVRKHVPADATALEIITTDLAQVKLEKWPAIHIQATYEHYGQKFQLALLVVQLEREQLRARFACHATDFARAFGPFIESLGTFTWDPQDEDPPAKSAVGISTPRAK
jgi:hypothetical protein